MRVTGSTGAARGAQGNQRAPAPVLAGALILDMRALPLIVGTLGFTLLYLANRRWFAGAYPVAWARRRGVRAAVHAVPVLWAGGLGLAFVARQVEAHRLSHAAFATAGAIVVLLAMTLVPLGIAAAVRGWAEGAAPEPVFDAPPPEVAPRAGATRRELLVKASAVLPVGGVVLAGAGAVDGNAAAHLVALELSFPELPPELEGFKILHYTDMHLGTFVDLLEVERLVALGKEARPDLVVLTGDIADDVDSLQPALRLFETIDPTHGLLASIGNHEYFRGLQRSLVQYARSNVHMLIEEGATLKIGGARLFVGGADDPRILRGDKMDFLHRTVNETLDGAPSDAFRLLLSHRPEGFISAAQAGFHLTLAGHTHGAQLGFDGRSLLEGFMPDKFLWGAYSSGANRLYTSSGAGHWFPFRLGCPREVPLIVLRRGPAGGVVKKVRLA